MHPTLTPRAALASFDPAPEPIELIPRVACKSQALRGRTCGLCLRCARKDAPGPRMAPRVMRILGVAECPDFVPHGCMVAPAEGGGHPVDRGGVENASTHTGVGS